MENRSLVTIAEHSKEKILYMLEMAKQFEMNPNRRLLQGKVVATLFFEPSTRTRLSFETAANRLGARVIGFTDPKATSSSKGETLKDTIMMVSSYADIIVMRHYLEGAARYASEVAPVPIVNAGDGANQHPSQTMLDLYSIYKTQGTLENGVDAYAPEAAILSLDVLGKGQAILPCIFQQELAELLLRNRRFQIILAPLGVGAVASRRPF